MIVMMNKLSYR